MSIWVALGGLFTLGLVAGYSILEDRRHRRVVERQIVGLVATGLAKDTRPRKERRKADREMVRRVAEARRSHHLHERGKS